MRRRNQRRRPHPAPAGLTELRGLPPYCNRYRDRHGRMRVYFRRKGCPSVPLPEDVSSDEFWEAYAKALRAKPDKPLLVKPDGTMAALIASYLQSPEFVAVRETTKAGYCSRIEAIRKAHGHRPVATMTKDAIVTKVLQPYAGKEGQRLAILKMLRILIRHARAIGLLDHDPSAGIERPKTKNIRSWTRDEIAQFEARWPIGTKQRLAFGLMYYLGQRPRVGLAGYSRRQDSYHAAKDRRVSENTDFAGIAGNLAVSAAGGRTILVTEYGKPFTVDGLSGLLRDAIRESGLPLSCQPHGLRKTRDLGGVRMHGQANHGLAGSQVAGRGRTVFA
jgi:enterobacteria phage integrase